MVTTNIAKYNYLKSDQWGDTSIFMLVDSDWQPSSFIPDHGDPPRYTYMYKREKEEKENLPQLTDKFIKFLSPQLIKHYRLTPTLDIFNPPNDSNATRSTMSQCNPNFE